MKNFWKKLSRHSGIPPAGGKRPALPAGRPIMVQAPMSGVTDQAFRLMLAKYGKPDVFWTEFISASALFSPKAQKYCLDVLKFSKGERPIVAQIFGANLDELEKASQIIAKLGFDGIDINMGCPDRNVEKTRSWLCFDKKSRASSRGYKSSQKRIKRTSCFCKDSSWL